MVLLTSLARPNQELMALEASVGLLGFNDTLQKLLLFSSSYTYLLALSYTAVLV